MKKVKVDKKMTLAALTFPIFIELFFNMLMGNADTLMLSQYSDESVAAVGVTNQIIFVMIVILGFVTVGTMVLMAQHLGAKQEKEASEIAVVSIVANLILGIVLSATVFFFGEDMLRMMKIEDNILDDAHTYLTIVGSFIFVQAIILTIGAILRSYGYTKDAMYVALGMNIIHVIGNYLVLFEPFGLPVLGVEGTAWSTTISRFVGLIAIIIFLLKRMKEPLPFTKVFSLPISHTKNLLRIGLPSAGEQLSYNLSQMVIMYFIATIGTEAITTRVYTMNIMMFIFLGSLAISQGTQILIGHYIGAREYNKAYDRALKSLKISILISIAVSIVFAIFSHQLLSIFTDNNKIITMGSTLIMLTILLEPGRAFNLVLIGSLRAAGDINFPLMMGIISMWGVAVSISYILGIHFGLGLIGIWIAFITDEWLRGVLMLWRWRSKIWMEKSFIRG